MKEKDLLSSFLVGNELHDSITFTKFTSYFPPAYRSSPEVKDLYRAFMNSRHQIRTRVRRNIEIEARRNPFHTSSEQEPQQQEREKEQDRVMALEGFDELVPEDMDICMEVEDVDKHLTLDQAIHELSVAEKIFKKEIEELEQECSAIAQEFQDLDQEVDFVRVPGVPFEGFNEAALASDLQSLIAMCNSLTSEVAKAKE